MGGVDGCWGELVLGWDTGVVKRRGVRGKGYNDGE
jgi:hypothetical protein